MCFCAYFTQIYFSKTFIQKSKESVTFGEKSSGGGGGGGRKLGGVDFANFFFFFFLGGGGGGEVEKSGKMIGEWSGTQEKIFIFQIS